MSNLALNQNQTFQSPMLGQVTMDPQPNTIPAQIYPSSAATVIVAGCAVKLVATTPGVGVIVDVCNGTSDGPIFGIIPYNMRKNSYSPSDSVEVVGRGGILMLKTYAAVPRGAAVVVRNPAVATDDPMVESSLTVGGYIAGVALGHAAAGSALIKVQVSQGVVSATGVISVTP